MNIDDKIRDEKLQYDINREFNYSYLGKTFEKQIKTIEDQGEKQVKTLNTLKSDNDKLPTEDVIPESVFANDKAKKEFNKMIEIEKDVDRDKLFYKQHQNKYYFKNFQTIRTFGKDIYNGEITLEEADKDQSDLIEKINDFIKRTKKDEKKKMLEKTCTIFMKVKKWFLMSLKVKYF